MQEGSLKSEEHIASQQKLGLTAESECSGIKEDRRVKTKAWSDVDVDETMRSSQSMNCGMR